VEVAVRKRVGEAETGLALLPGGYARMRDFCRGRAWDRAGRKSIRRVVERRY